MTIDQSHSTRASAASTVRLDTWGRWVGVYALGQLLGLGVMGLVGWRALRGGVGSTDLVAWMPVNLRDVACAAEGVLGGAVQWIALRRVLPDVARSEWTFATGVGAFVASALGLTPWTLAGASVDVLPRVPSALAAPAGYAAAAGLGVATGLVLSVFQGWVLRRSGAGAGRWLAANALGWTAALPLLAWASRVLGGVQGPAVVALALGAALLSGAVVGVVVGAVGPWERRAARPHEGCATPKG